MSGKDLQPGTGEFRRHAIVNRGEAAMRLIHAVREFNAEHDLDLKTIAIYTEPDARAMFEQRMRQRSGRTTSTRWPAPGPKPGTSARRSSCPGAQSS